MKLQYTPLKILTFLTLTSLLSASQNTFYVEVAGGMAFEDSIKTEKIDYVYKQGPIARLSIGYKIDNFRVEIEERYKIDKLQSTSAQDSYSVGVDGDLKQNSQMINFYYNGYNDSKLLSSIGLGAGISDINLNDIYRDYQVFSAQGLFSVGYMITPSFIFATNYAYFYTSKSENFEAKGENSFTLSLRYLF